jgi:16S rRNA (guanine527-N7)-methyltransferase
VRRVAAANPRGRQGPASPGEGQRGGTRRSDGRWALVHARGRGRADSATVPRSAPGGRHEEALCGLPLGTRGRRQAASRGRDEGSPPGGAQELRRPWARYTGAVQSADAVDAVVSAARGLGRTVGQDEAEKVVRFFELLLVWNERINLTGARSLETLLSEHLPDSLALAELVPAGQTLLEVGAGGGLPGIPFALLRPDVQVTLLEPRSRRVAFLRTAVRDLGVPATVDPRRLEQVTGRYDVLSARAVLPPDAWLAAAPPHLAPQGRVVVYLPEPGAWGPPPGVSVAASVRYPAARSDRLALALIVPRGT